MGDDAPKVAFHLFESVPQCSMHKLLEKGSCQCQQCSELPEEAEKGKFFNRKNIILNHEPMSIFMKDHYLPQLQKYKYHLPHIIMLGKYQTGKDRKAALQPGDIDTTRDYAERLQFEFANEIMSQHFGNSRTLSMEGSSVRFFPSNIVGNADATYTQEDTSMHFHSHLCDGKVQNAASTHFHMDVLHWYMKPY